MGLITPDYGLKLEPDTSPYTGTTLTSVAALIDGTKFTAATGNYWYTHYSYGLDLGQAYEVTHLKAYGYVGNTPTGYYNSSYDSFKAYKSDDNSTWTYIEQFDAPSLSDLAANEWTFTATFSSAQTARYFKLVYIDSSTIAFAPGGSSGKIGELEAYGTVVDIVDLTGETLNFGFTISNAETAGIEVVDLDGETLDLGFTISGGVPGWKAILAAPLDLGFTISGALHSFVVPLVGETLDMPFSIVAPTSMSLIGRDLWELNSYITRTLPLDSPIEITSSLQSRITRTLELDSSVR